MQITNQHAGFALMGLGAAAVANDFLPSTLSAVKGVPSGAGVVAGSALFAVGAFVASLHGKL